MPPPPPPHKTATAAAAAAGNDDSNDNHGSNNRNNDDGSHDDDNSKCDDTCNDRDEEPSALGCAEGQRRSWLPNRRWLPPAGASAGSLLTGVCSATISAPRMTWHSTLHRASPRLPNVRCSAGASGKSAAPAGNSSTRQLPTDTTPERTLINVSSALRPVYRGGKTVTEDYPQWPYSHRTRSGR